MRVLLSCIVAATLAACFAETEVETQSVATAPPETVPADFARFDTVTIDLQGPEATESPATFRDHRLVVTFTHENGGSHTVPGFFAADGDAANTGAESGNIWRARFTPALAGTWSWEADFRTGEDIALSLDASAGEESGPDGQTGTFTVSDTISTQGGHLVYDGTRYLRDTATDRPFIKTGAGSPENLLAYSGFSGTVDSGGMPFPALGENQLHDFEPHLRDALPTDPVWAGGNGESILGLVNYLGRSGVNAQYMVTMNYRGDGQDVWPWTGPEAMESFDVSKLAEWNILFEHMDARGVMKDIVLTETENESLFEAVEGLGIGTDFADTRKLYYREMVARFGHLRRLTWNLGEEKGVVGNTGEDPWRQPTSVAQRAEFAAFIDALDAYDHPVVSHNWPDEEDAMYAGLLGHPSFHGISHQVHHDYVEKITEWLDRSAESGRQWLLFVDEPLGWEFGARPDADDPGQDITRTTVLWPTLFAGASGIDWYFGWQNNAPTSDLSNEDMRSRDLLWRQSALAREFMEAHLPFTEMANAPSETPGATQFEKAGEVYALYLPEGGNAELRLPVGTWRTEWFDPRNGGGLIPGALLKQQAPGLVSTRQPPSAPDKDWVVILRRAG